ncbi:MAG: DUF4160 domain-containing protein [Lachnospiraceae bacterium]|nr:MAG: DUF4160 domain-containing protein [Lachnospiraceae bacterium]
MPELSRFQGIIIKLFFNDVTQHHKPHIHAYYGDYEAAIAVDGELLAGSLPSKQYKMICGWLALHEEEVYKAWNQAVRSEHFDKIEPLH